MKGTGILALAAVAAATLVGCGGGGGSGAAMRQSMLARGVAEGDVEQFADLCATIAGA